MPDVSWQDRIRGLVAAGVLIASIGAGTAFSGHSTQPGDVIQIATFNIQVFGETKAKKQDVMDVLAQVARQFDVMAVEEVRDRSGTVATRFLDRINRDAEEPYAMIVGPRLGRTSSKEQYVIYYKPSVVTFVDSFTVPDPDDRFEREPLVARFQSGQFDFRLVVSHIKPDDASDELAALADVAEAIADPTEEDVILLGDFNADCSYFNENSTTHPLKSAAYHWVIGNDVKTAVKSDCTYDRIVLRDATFNFEYVPNSGQVFKYDDRFGLTDPNLVRQISDHYPVYAEFRTTGPDDDGPGGPRPAALATSTATGSYVASRTGHAYYRVGCNAARRLSPGNVVSFQTEQQAQQAGYRRSTSQGC